MKDYSKTAKWIMLGLLCISILVFLACWIFGFEANGAVGTDVLLIWTYAMVVLSVASIVGIGGCIAFQNDKSFLKKVIIVLGGIAALVVVVYLISPGKPALGMLQQPAQATLRLTDTVLNLTYIAAACTILAIIGGEIYRKVMDKKEAK